MTLGALNRVILCAVAARMRGTQFAILSEVPTRRFIPAHAGNTRSREAVRGSVAVHPRACGEHRLLTRSSSGCAGSSPRMRGTLSAWELDTLFMRFIPAHAGNTARVLPEGFWDPVHPRACGEHTPS